MNNPVQTVTSLDGFIREVIIMMKRQWFVGLGGAALIVAATFLSGLVDEGHGKMGHGGHDQEEQEEHSAHYLKHLLKQAKEIGLTQEQISKLKAIQLDFKRTEARLEADSKIAKLELHALVDDEKADLTAIQAKVEQLKKAEGALMLAGIKGQRDAMAMLTPDQREKERAQLEKMKSGGEGQQGGGMGGKGRGGMGGGGHGGTSGGEHAGGEQGGGQHQH
jgi:Spy/CpxP family protein refolding chaperone